MKHFLSLFKKTQHLQGNSVKEKYFFQTNAGNCFFVSEDGWFLINAKNHFSVPNIKSKVLNEIFKHTSANPQYNYLFHAETIGKTGDHVLVTNTTNKDVPTEANLESYVKEYTDHFFFDEDNLKSIEKGFINRPVNNAVKDSLDVKVFTKDGFFEEYVVIPGQGICVSCSASPQNKDRYEKIMFEIVDSIGVLLN